MKPWIRYLPYKQMATIICVVTVLSVIDFLFIQPEKYWRNDECDVCSFLIRTGEWVPFLVGALTSQLPKSWRSVPLFEYGYVMVVFEYIFIVVFSIWYADEFLRGIAWSGSQSEAGFVAALWGFWLTCGLLIGVVIKSWRSIWTAYLK
ncbi:MAG: hypothetical protein PHY62_08540 [Gallionella sp.]|nr:hypothetical protein [Gallionella sp.]